MFSHLRAVSPVILVAALLATLSGCSNSTSQSEAPQNSLSRVVYKEYSTTPALPGDLALVQTRGKIVSAKAPAKALLGMIWINTDEKREMIFDGAQWVPHDSTVEEFYRQKNLLAKSGAKTVALIQSDVCTDGAPDCTPTGAHAKHGSFTCKTCHKVGGRLTFDKTGPAYRTGIPAPTFDATAKTCTNVACHSVAPGVFNYSFPDDTGEPMAKSFEYGSTPRPTPAWNTTAPAGCTACHDNPPNKAVAQWHSGNHGNQSATGERNQCQFCHPDASSPGNGIGNTITNPSLHANGILNLQVTFKSTCFGCH